VLERREDLPDRRILLSVEALVASHDEIGGPCRVLDTNVLVAAIRSDQGASRRLLMAVLGGEGAAGFRFPLDRVRGGAEA
jgi:hypothetical protein